MSIADRFFNGMDKVYTVLSSKPEKAVYPRIFVHGLMGWGEYDAVNSVIPYWGLASGNLLRYLRSKGYVCRAASVGPVSSAWDRACELYAQLTGTVTDYGIVHSEKYGHARFGRAYDTPLVDLWDADSKLDFIAHSFGGATVRLLIRLLEKGDAEELRAARERGLTPSPLFTGGRYGWVNSLTTLAAPHNGTTCIAANGGNSRAVQLALLAAAGAAGLQRAGMGFDLKLEHFGIENRCDEKLSDALLRIAESDFFTGGDNAWTDLDIPGAQRLNRLLYASPDVCYFSYAGDMTSAIGDIRLPAPLLSYALMSFCRKMGKYGEEEWRKNDGLVNTVSALYPEHEEHICVSFEPGAKAVPGIWYSLPPKKTDHMGFIGGLGNTGFISVREFYARLMDNIDNTMHGG